MDRKKALKILGLSENASKNEIKEAWKRLIFKYHTDKNNSSGAAEKFDNVQKAYKYLSNNGPEEKEPELHTCYKCKKRYEDDGRWINFSNKMFCSTDCFRKWQKQENGGYLNKNCRICKGFHSINPEKCEISLSAFSELKNLDHWKSFTLDIREHYKAEIRSINGMPFILEDFKQEVNKILKKARKENEKIETQINQEREQCAEKIKHLKDWSLLNEEAQEEIIEALKRCRTSDQFSRQINLAKDQIEKARLKNPDIPDKNELNELISEAKKGKNWNNFQNLTNLLTQIKSLQTSDFYNKHKAEIHAIEERLKELSPEDFKNSIEEELEKKLKSNGLSKEELSQETKKKFQEAVASGDVEKKQAVEEAIIEEGTEKELNEIIVAVKKVITDQSNLTRTQKEELLNKILKIISGNTYQRKVYQKQKNKIDKLVSELRKEIVNEQENSEFSWPEKIGVAVVISLGITILVSVAMKISAHRKQRNIQ